jgi:hypothetical protein
MDYKQKYNKYKTKYLSLKLGLQIGGKRIYSQQCVNNCVKTHSQNGDNYVWLNVLGHGPVKKIEFEEPVGSGNWRLYTDKWWETHCKVIDHSPDNLMDAHVKAFINPKTRFARKRFTFSDGLITEPTPKFYELEQNYFKYFKYCEPNHKNLI